MACRAKPSAGRPAAALALAEDPADDYSSFFNRGASFATAEAKGKFPHE
jgi:hypothetical protein